MAARIAARRARDLERGYSISYKRLTLAFVIEGIVVATSLAGAWLFASIYAGKDPLAFWMMATSMAAFGGAVGSWAARLPAVLMGIGTLLLTGLLGRRAAGGSTNAGLGSALVLLCTPLFIDNVPQAELNVPFAFWITLAVTL